MFDTDQRNETVFPAGPSGKTVTLERVWKEYGRFTAVRDVSFSLHPGEFLSLLGPSGSGKTSTLMMVAGFEHPSRGSIAVNGVDVLSHTPQQRNFGVVFQGYALFPHMTAQQNVEFPLRMRGHNASARRRLAADMLAKVGLEGMADRRPRQMSGGQQQRVALARALVFQPNALLLDEPLGALDKNLRERMQAEIKELQRKTGISILFVTHDQDEAMTMSDRIAVMDGGRIVQVGAPQDVYYRPLTPFVAGFFGETNLLTCQVLDAGTPYATVMLDGGAKGPALAPQHGARAGEERNALLSVRPERIGIMPPKAHVDFEVEATVTGQTFLGRYFRVEAQTAQHRFAVLSSDLELMRSIVVGTPVTLGWTRDDAQILSRDDAGPQPFGGTEHG